MGLVFAIQPDLKKTTQSTLLLKSSKKKFGMGGTLLFGGALLATMYTAALPLFNLMWKEGALFDKALAWFLTAPIALYPLLALGCFFYQEVIRIEKTPGGLVVDAFEKLGPLKWNTRKLSPAALNDFKVENWKGALNTAALDAMKKGIQDRYATRGHWMLKLRKDSAANEIVLERRAKKEEIDDLYLQIKSFVELNA